MMQPNVAFRRTYGAAMGQFGEVPERVALQKARRAAEHARLALVTYPGGHPLALTANLTWQAAEKAANAARSAQDKTVVWREAEKAMRGLNLHGEALAEAVAEQGKRIADVHVEAMAKAPPPPPPPPEPTARAVLAAYRKHGVGFVLDGDDMRLTNAADLLPGDLACLRKHKAGIAEILKAETITL